MREQSRFGKLIDIGEETLLLVIWLILVLNLFYSWSLFVNPIGDGLGEARTQPDEVTHVIYLFMFATISVLCAFRWKSVVTTLWVAWPILLLIGWSLLSVLWGTDPATGLSAVGRFIIAVLLSAYVASKYDLDQFIAFLTRGFAVAVLASFAVMVVVPRLGYSNIGGGYEHAWRGAFTHKNWLGSAMSLALMVCGYSYKIRANSRLLSATTLIGCLFLLIMSRSATALISTLVSGLVVITGFALLAKRRWAPLRGIALLGLCVGLFVLVMSPVFDIGLKDLPQVPGRTADLTGRAEVWHAVWGAIREKPLIGHGYGFWSMPSVTRSNIWLGAKWEAPHAHNTWLDAALQLGLVGVVLLTFAWVVVLLRSVWLVLVRQSHAALFFLAILVSCLTTCLVETMMIAPVLVTMFWFTTAHVYVSRLMKERLLASRALPQDCKPRLWSEQARSASLVTGMPFGKLHNNPASASASGQRP